MEPLEAVVRVLGESAPDEMHWTVVWDEALRRGYVDPLVKGARESFLRALGDAVKAGRIEKTSTGTYRARSPAGG